MFSLFKIYNVLPLLAIAAIIRVLFPDLSWYSYFAIIISLHQFYLLFSSIGDIIPIRYLFGSFMCLQMCIGPMLAYNGLDQYQYFLYRMQVPEAMYFSYALPAVILFIIGLHARAGNLKGEFIDTDAIEKYVSSNKDMPFFLIAIGFFASILSNFFSSELAFVFYLLGGFKFIGVFLLIVGYQKLKVLPLILVLTSIISSSLGQAMFHDLLTWIIFAGAVYCIRNKPRMSTKVLMCVGFVLLALVVQQLKSSYRKAMWFEGKEAGFETYVESFKNNKDGFFSFNSLAPSTTRINQGFIITHIMKTVPRVEPYSEGRELMQIFEAAFLPRIIAPNKLIAGDRHLFNRYTGLNVQQGTSMGLSAMGDAYINFGVLGGCVFMLVLGLLFSEVLNTFDKISSDFPIILLFTPLVFYYPIRPDSELQTVLGHLVKSCFFIYVVFRIWKKSLQVSLAH